MMLKAQIRRDGEARRRDRVGDITVTQADSDKVESERQESHSSPE